MTKQIKSLYCPECGKKTKFENNPESKSAWGVFCTIIDCMLWCIIPVLGWGIALYKIISLFTKKDKEDLFYCCTCGTCIRVKK